MPFPAQVAQIDQEQERVGRVFPSGLRERLLVSNGGSLFVGDEEWTLFPVWDPTTKRSAARSSGHIARETSALYEGLAGVLMPGLIAVAENGDGDYLMLDGSAHPRIWRHETNSLDQVDVDWKRDRPSARGRPSRAEALDRVATALTSISTGPNATVVIEAPETGIYVQFASGPEGVVGEAVGEGNLSKLYAYQMGPTMRSMLPGLGWRQPVDSALDHGNWTQTWKFSDWDPVSIARLVVRTFSEVHGLEPWALAVSVGRD